MFDISSLRADHRAIKGELDSIKNNTMFGMSIDDFLYRKLVTKIDPIKYCEEVLRAHMPEDKRSLHANQIELIRAVCNPNIRMVAALMARQCISKGSIIHTRDGKLIRIEDSKDSWETNANAKLFEVKLSGGQKIICTDNHPVMTNSGWKQVKDLTKDDNIFVLNKWNKFGSGRLSKKMVSYNLIREMCNLIVTDNVFDIDYLINFINALNRHQTYVFFTELFKLADIKINKNRYVITIKTHNYLFSDILRELLNKIGITGYAKDNCLKIYGKRNIHYLKKINVLIDIECVQKLHHITFGEDTEELYTTKLLSIKEAGYGPVYDITYKDKGWFICGGIKVHNSGKCFAKDTKILMANGEKKKVQDVKVGEYVLSPDSKPVMIKELGTGKEEMYEIIPKDNSESFTVNKSHILSLLDRNGNVKNITVKDYLNLSNKERKHLLGYRAKVEYPNKEIDVDLYYYGLWLTLEKQKSNHRIIDEDEEFINYVYKYANSLNVRLETKLVNDSKIKLKNYLYKYPDKKISKDLLINSSNNRLKLLSGIIDGLGYYIPPGRTNTMILSLNDKDLILDIKELLQSLGYIIKYSYDIKNGLYYKGLYILEVSGNFKDLPIHIYKDSKILKNQKENKFEFDIKEKGIDDYYGFTIDSEDHLFLLGNYVVTHNTESIASFSGFLLDNYPNMRIGIFTPRIQQAEINVGRTSVFFQMNEERLNNKIVKCTKQKIELSNGSYVQAVSGSDQSNIEGLTFDIIILDEAQKITNYTWSERIYPKLLGRI